MRRSRVFVPLPPIAPVFPQRNVGNLFEKGTRESCDNNRVIPSYAMSENNVEKINGQIFGLVIGALLLMLTAATASLFTSRDVLAGIKVLNLAMTTRPIDIPFILALLLLTKNLYDFYTHIVCKLKESTVGEYYSMGIMIVMLLVSILAF